MTTRMKVSYVNGNKALEVIDSRDGSVAATLRGPGDEFEQNIHSNAQFTVRECGEFYGSAEPQGMQANATVDENNTDANAFESGELPPGAGDNGSNVDDVQLSGRETRPAGDAEANAQRNADNMTARTENSPKTRR